MDNFKAYWKEILNLSLKGAGDFLGLWGIILEFIIGLVASFFIIKPQSWSDVSWRDALITLLVIIAVYAITVGVFILKTPPVVDTKKKKDLVSSKRKIKRLEERISRKNIKPYSDPTYFVQGKTVHCNVLIENDSGKALSNYYNRIEKIYWIIDEEEIELPFVNNISFIWPGDPGIVHREMNPIASGDRARISIAETINSSYFKLDTRQTVRQDLNKFEKPGIFKIVFIVGGTIGNNESDVINKFHVIIDYKGGDEIQIIEFKENNDC
jgi:hypothetical protein